MILKKDVFFFYICIAEFAGVPAAGNLSGHSLVPLVSKARDFSKTQRPDWVLSEYHGCNVNASTYMLRKGRWKYIAYADGQSVPPQLFGEFLDSDMFLNTKTFKGLLTFSHFCIFQT